jgi:adenylosuccinate synthase
MPYNTWTNTTFANADTLLDEVGISDRIRVGCLRTYYTRHGAGPFETERPDLLAALPELYNVDNEHQGSWRVGTFDWNLAKKACDLVGGIDYLALSHLDYLPALGIHNTKEFLDDIRCRLHTSICMKGRGPKASDRILSYIG